MRARCATLLVVIATSALGCGRRHLEGKGDVGASPPSPSAPVAAAPEQSPPPTKEGVRLEEGFAPIVQRVSPAVVNISSVRFVRPPPPERIPFFSDPFFRDFFGGGRGGPPGRAPGVRREQALGSGVLVSRDGYVLTNAHVIEDASEVTVALPDMREFRARLVGADAKTDIAVLKIDGDGFPFATFDDSSAVRVGDLALAIGDPFGIGQTVTFGIISAVGRGNVGIADYEDFLQTDAAINPGNSGGALIDTAGRLIGINTAILSRGGGGNQGIGFAIPSNLAREVMDQILRQGHVVRGALGVVVQDLTPAIAQALGLKADTRGVLVSDIAPGSPAAQAGLARGDVVVALDGKPVESGSDFRIRIAGSPPGTRVTLRVLRGGQTRELTAALTELPEPAPPEAPRSSPAPAASAGLGVEAAPLSEDVRRQLSLPPDLKGVAIVGVNPAGRAATAGLRPGDVVVEADRAPVDSPAALKRQLDQAAKHPLLLLVWRDGRTHYVAVEP